MRKNYEQWKLELKIFATGEIFTLVSSGEATVAEAVNDVYEDNWWVEG